MFLAGGRCSVTGRTDVVTADLRARCCRGLHGGAGAGAGCSGGRREQRRGTEGTEGTGEEDRRMCTLCRKAGAGDQRATRTDDAD
jgi:hypothetical protein